MADDLVVVELEHTPGKLVRVPREILERSPLAARGYAVETGQATWEEVNGEAAAVPGASGKFDAAMISAGRTLSDLGSNVRQAMSEIFGDESAAGVEKEKQRESARLAESVEDEFPVSSFVGSTLPFFAVPGGLGAQVAAGAATGALEGDTAAQRIGGASLGAGLAVAGQKFGDVVGQRIQNAAQRFMGNPNASARAALTAAGVPLSLSQRTDFAPSRALTRFFERGRFVLTGSQPRGAAQQAKLTELVTEALGINAKKLTREALGDAVSRNRAVFREAADRAGGKFFPDGELITKVDDVVARFDEIGTDSPQVQRIFDRFKSLRNVDPIDGMNATQYLQLRSDLSQATTLSRGETSSLVDAIGAMDDLIARNVPDLADDLVTARDRFRMLMAIRRGSALSPQGDINVATFTKNLEKIFTDFDANVPLPRSLGPAGEAIAGFNQIADPFRTSATAENLAAIGGPSLGGADPGAFIRALTGVAAPFAGGGTGGLIGGGAGRIAASEAQQAIQGPRVLPPGVNSPIIESLLRRGLIGQ